jgi:DHA1 family tetracycline resistance protein-like MFS transporter
MERPTLPNTALVVLLAIGFLTALGLSLVFPVLPFIVARSTGDPGQVALWVGALTSVYAGCALFAGPILGTLSDRVGRKPILVVCLAGSAIGWVIFGIGGSILALLLARVVDGVTAGEQSVVFAAMADITTPAERAKRFGLMGAVSGMAFLIGPALGGLLAGIDVAAPAFAAAGATALTAVLTLVALPESLPADRRSAETRFDLNPFGALRETARQPGLARRMVVFALIVSTLTVVSSNFAVLSFDVLAWSPVQIGWLLTGVGVVDIVVQGGLLGVFVRLAGERGVIIGGLVGLSVSFALFVGIAAFVPSAILMVVAGLLFATAEGSTTATLQATLSSAVAEDEQGGLAGGLSAISSAAGLVLPLLTGLLYAQVAPAAPYVLSLGAILVALALTTRLTDRSATPSGETAAVH